ncbi:MAG: hypothetical protein BAJALOKI1v1_680001 [Promethearchaeota archaeon]|nr:MAG: hypothetical protein BAJALOKI1v1_680001 [Candidatus Lokiarchaeota archaeon]
MTWRELQSIYFLTEQYNKAEKGRRQVLIIESNNWQQEHRKKLVGKQLINRD